MAGQGLFFRSFGFISNGRGLLKNRITNVNAQFTCLGIKQDVRAKLNELKIPEKPKKPLTPYLRFVKDHRDDIIKGNPNLKPTDVIKKCAEKWKNVSNELKTKYTEAYNLEHEKYDIQFMKYQESLSPEQKEAIQDFQNEKKEDKKKRKLRKLYKETNKPKRPMNAYMHYILDQSKLRNESVKNLMSQLKDEWPNLPAQERKKYEDIVLKEKEKYEIAMHNWEAQMVAEGRDDLVRSKFIEEKIPSRGHECLHSKSSVNTGEGTLFHNETKEHDSTKIVHPVLQDISKNSKKLNHKNIPFSSNPEVNSFVSKDGIVVTDNKKENLTKSESNQQNSSTKYEDMESAKSLDRLKNSVPTEKAEDSINKPLKSEKCVDEEKEKNSLTNRLRKFFKF